MKTTKEKTYLVFIAVFAVAILCVLVFGLSGRKSKTELPVVTPRPTDRVVIKEVEKLVEVEKTVSVETVEEGLRDMGFLVTEEYYFTDVVSYSSIKKFLNTNIALGFTESGYLAAYSGTVSAGVDFSAVTVEKDENAGCLTVHIPKAVIQAVTIDPDSFQLYSEKVGLGNPISVADFNSSLVELENTARDKALERGILERAAEHGEKVIRGFAEGLAGGDYTLRFVTE